MGVPTAKFTLSAAQKIADVVRRFNDQPTDRTGSRSIRRSFNERGFWARIVCYCPLVTDQWKYSFVEMQRTSSGWTIKPNGRLGNCCSTNYALNSVEAYNGDNDYFGNGQSITVQKLEPIRGEPIVWMRQDWPDSDSLPVYTFAAENAQANDTPDASTCDCNPSGPDFCLYTFVSQWYCSDQSWTPPQQVGVDCGPIPGTAGTWQFDSGDTNIKTYTITIAGAPCSEVDQCNDWPATPSKPTFTPSCGSSSSDTEWCLYTFVSYWYCSDHSWTFPVQAGTDCGPVPGTAGSWQFVSGDTNIKTYTYTVAGGPCDSPGDCSTWPDAPAKPTFTPSCGPESSSSSQSSQSSQSFPSSSSSEVVARCVYLFTSTYTCGDGWSTPVLASKTCQVTEPIIGSWQGTGNPNAYFYTTGGRCADLGAAMDCPDEGATPPGSDPDWTPDCSSSSQSVGSSSSETDVSGSSSSNDCSCRRKTISVVTDVTCNDDGTISVTKTDVVVFDE